MKPRYLHFTDEAGAEGILDSETIWNTSYGPKGATFAVREGGAWVPKVQMSELGRAKNRNMVVVFTTPYLPDVSYPEEVMWHLEQLPVEVVDIISIEEAQKLLNNSIKQDEEMDLLVVPTHPAFNDWGDWTRMPEDFKPWIPGKDNEKYLTAKKLWIETKNIETVRNYWNKDKINERLSFLIKNFLKELFV